MLTEKFDDPRKEWSVFTQVANRTGAGRYNFADFLAVHNWKPFLTIAVEIKVYRNDWIKELENPAKAEVFASQVNEFWVAAPPKVVLPDEVPEGWGLYHCYPDGLKAVKRPKRDMEKQLSADLMRSLLRQASMVPKDPWAWRYDGKDLTDEDLVEIARRKAHVHVEAEVKRQTFEGVQKVLREDRDYLLGVQIRRLYGRGFLKNEEILKELEGLGNGVPQERVNKLVDEIEKTEGQLGMMKRLLTRS